MIYPIDFIKANQKDRWLYTEENDMWIYMIFDLLMAIIMFLFGIYFYKSDGKAVRFLSGYNMKSEEERMKYDENAMCKSYGKRMMIMAIPFLLGIIIDIPFTGIGCLSAWGTWIILFIFLLIDRNNRERNIKSNL